MSCYVSAALVVDPTPKSPLTETITSQIGGHPDDASLLLCTPISEGPDVPEARREQRFSPIKALQFDCLLSGRVHLVGAFRPDRTRALNLAYMKPGLPTWHTPS